MNEDIDFYNKNSPRLHQPGEADEDDLNGKTAAARSSIDPDLADDSDAAAANQEAYQDDEEDESLTEMMLQANLKKSKQDQAWWWCDF